MCDYLGLSTGALDFVAAAQAQDMWCWAACVQTILNWYGVAIDQQSIVSCVLGARVNEPGTEETISASLNGWGFHANGRRFVVRSRVAGGAPPLQILFREFARQHPVLVTFNEGGASIGHAVVLTSISRIGSEITSLVYRDPWPSAQNIARTGRKSWTCSG